MKRRSLLQKLAVGAISLPFIGRSLDEYLPKENIAEWKGEFDLTKTQDEAFWKAFKKTHYDVSDKWINLENGYFGVQPKMVVDAYVESIKKVNSESSAYARRTFNQQDLGPVMDTLAKFSGAAREELLITRNATEALNILIQGIDFQPGDEVIFSEQDYPSMIEAFEMLEKTKGIIIKRIEVPMIPESDAQLVNLYQAAMTNKTRCILVTHLIHLTGQIMPVKAIADMARPKGVEVIVDAAHSFAHLDFKISDLGCDFVGVNLHKWFSAPIGMGLMYVKKNRIKDLSPMFGDVGQREDNVNKLGHFGTLSFPTLLTVPKAAEFNNMVTIPVKEARLRYLQNYWTKEIEGIANAELLTPTEAKRSCAIATFKLRNLDADEVIKRLYDDFGVFTVKRNLPENEEGIRVTPNLYSSTSDVDRLLEGIQKLSKM